MPSNKYPLLCLCMLFATAILLSACQPSAPSVANHDAVAAYVDVINYSHDRSYQFTLRDLSQNEAPEVSGGIVWPLAAGGSANCCISLPKQWHSGLKVRLDWAEADETIKKETGSFSRDLEIPRYEQVGNLYITFLPKGEVALVVSPVEPGNAQWPGSVKLTPWDYCVATAGRKACKAAMPKYGVPSWDEMQGLCTYYKQKNEDPALCEDFYQRCITAYEDEPQCKSVLWGERKK
jgi:hypothetical protein